jgi:hypothetical protein
MINKHKNKNTKANILKNINKFIKIIQIMVKKWKKKLFIMIKIKIISIKIKLNKEIIKIKMITILPKLKHNIKSLNKDNLII